MVDPAVTPEIPAVSTPEPRMVKESDLLVIKNQKEGLEHRLQETESTHKSQVDKALQAQYASEAKVKTLEERLASISPLADEHPKIKLQLETAQKSSEGLSKKVLEYRMKLIATEYKIPVDTLANKTLEQLDLYEEALKAVGGTRTGNFAVGGSGGSAAPESPTDRAKRTISEWEKSHGREAKVSSAASKV